MVEPEICHWSNHTAMASFPAVFFKEVTQGDAVVIEGERFRRIRSSLKRPNTLIELHFLESVGQIFDKFLTFM